MVTDRTAEPAAERPPLPVVFALHDPEGAYWAYTAVAMSSVADHARGPVAFHVLHDASLHPRARERLAAIAAELAAPLSFVPVEVPPGVETRRLRHFSPASIFRLMIPRLFADEPLVIYLDSDLVANGLDITELATLAPPDAPISAVHDPYIALPQEHAAALRELGLDPASYFNSGVLGLRPKLLPRDLPEAFTAFSDGHPMALHPDQDFLNLRFAGRVHFLDGRFNCQAGAFQGSLLQPLGFYDGRIVHYSGGVKPLDGALAPGLIPFWAHARRVPELMAGRLGSPSKYLFPVEGMPDSLKVERLTPAKPPA
jgi:lipopolysaccharide biosynthesis glycosyltransferase